MARKSTPFLHFTAIFSHLDHGFSSRFSDALNIFNLHSSAQSANEIKRNTGTTWSKSRAAGLIHHMTSPSPRPVDHVVGRLIYRFIVDLSIACSLLNFAGSLAC